MNGIITEQNYPVEKVWILKSLTGFIITILILTVFFIFTSFKDGIDLNVVFYLALVPINAFIIMLRRSNFHYAIEDKFITIKQGILSKQQRHIPYGVIQNIYVKQDIF